MPIYQMFVEQAMELKPRFIIMVIPSRWMASGLGLREFRANMLADHRLCKLVDYPVSSDVFPGVEIKGGVCYFLWNCTHDDLCSVTTRRGEDTIGPMLRDLGEFDVFVRDVRALPILKKVLATGEPSINCLLARDKEFGWTSNFSDFKTSDGPDNIPIHYIKKMKRGVGFVDRSQVIKSQCLIDTWKILVPKASYGNGVVPSPVLGKPLIASAPSVCTQSFLFFYVGSRMQAESLRSYYCTRFFRFLVSLRKITQDATHSTYRWVPVQMWDRTWTDEELYKKYDINDEEQAYIAAQVSELVDNDAD